MSRQKQKVIENNFYQKNKAVIELSNYVNDNDVLYKELTLPGPLTKEFFNHVIKDI